jgi:redox-sensing transcriptional repressor
MTTVFLPIDEDGYAKPVWSLKMKPISKNTLKRLPVYLSYLKQLPEERVYVSATAIAEGLKLGDVQVRKDLALVSGKGKPKTGYDRARLIETLENYLGYDEQKNAIIVGAGKLGLALYEYKKFADYGLNISAAFDADIKKAGYTPDGKRVYHISEMEEYCHLNNVKIGIITVPVSEAEKVCRKMTECGICYIWNFAPTYISAPAGVNVHNENMAVSLAVLTGRFDGSEDGEE